MKKIVAIALIVVLVFAMASVAFASDVVSPQKGNTDTKVTPAPGKTSPQTGENFSALWVLLAGMLFLAAAVFCGAALKSACSMQS